MSIAGKRILIRVDGSHAIGLGHVFRMKALAKGLADSGAQLRFLTLRDAAANTVLEKTGIAVSTFKPEELVTAFVSEFENYKPDWILQDVLATQDEEMAVLKGLGPAKWIHFDDTGAGMRLADLVINAFVFHWGEYTGHSSDTKVYEGAEFMILQEEIETYRGRPHLIAKRAERIVLGFGGTDTHGVTGAYMKALNGIQLPHLSVTVILGPGTLESPELATAIAESNFAVELKKSVPDLFKEYHASDLVLCGGGNCLYELATLGIPSLSVACEPHELKNIHFWEKSGTTIGIGFRNAIKPEFSTVFSSILQNSGQRKAMSEAGKRVMNGSGLQKVLAILDTQFP